MGEGTSPTFSNQGVGARADSLADTFELSASAVDSDAFSGIDKIPSGALRAQRATPSIAVTEPVKASSKVVSDPRLSQAHANIESLGRCLAMLKDVRVKQSEYLQLLQGIPSPCTNK